MARLDDLEIHEALGLEPPEKVAPRNRTEDALQSLDELDRKHTKLIESQMKPGETFEQASDRAYRETPTLYPTLKKARARILAAKGFGDAATGGV